MMGPDLFKRWMDMLFWWLPRDGDQSKGQQPPRGEQQGGAGTPRKDDAPSKPVSPAKKSAPEPTTSTATSSTAAATEAAAKPDKTAQAPKPAPTPTPKAPSSSGDAVDDLTTIKGVGPAMAARLQDMGIRTFEDLAAADIKTITRKLREQSVVISEKKVEGWVQAARQQG